MKALTKRTIALLLCIMALISFSAAFAVPVTGRAAYPARQAEGTPAPQAADTPEQPLKDVIIGIDPGHQFKADSGQEQISPNDEKTTKDRMTRGCTGVRSGVNEYDVNRVREADGAASGRRRYSSHDAHKKRRFGFQQRAG